MAEELFGLGSGAMVVAAPVPRAVVVLRRWVVLVEDGLRHFLMLLRGRIEALVLRRELLEALGGDGEFRSPVMVSHIAAPPMNWKNGSDVCLKIKKGCSIVGLILCSIG